MAHLRYIVSNQSSRQGVKPDTIIIHTTEGHNRPGVSDLRGLANFFDWPETEASAHFGVDAEGNSIRMVPDAAKAWTAGAWNARSLNIELIGFARWSRAFWKRSYRRGLMEAAEIVAAWSIKYDIPIPSRPKAPGVAGHVHVSGPGGHWDPGPGFPWKVFLLMAKLQKRRLLKRQNQSINRRMRERIMRALRS